MVGATRLLYTIRERPGYLRKALLGTDIKGLEVSLEKIQYGQEVREGRQGNAWQKELVQGTESKGFLGEGPSEETQTSSEIEGSQEELDEETGPKLRPEEKEQFPGIPPRHYNEACEFLMPYRARYCKTCEAVVAKFDHHCFWIGGCVGELNHRSFLLMLLCMTVEFSILFCYVKYR